MHIHVLLTERIMLTNVCTLWYLVAINIKLSCSTNVIVLFVGHAFTFR